MKIAFGLFFFWVISWISLQLLKTLWWTRTRINFLDVHGFQHFSFFFYVVTRWQEYVSNRGWSLFLQIYRLSEVELFLWLILGTFWRRNTAAFRYMIPFLKKDMLSLSRSLLKFILLAAKDVLNWGSIFFWKILVAWAVHR